MPNQPPSPNWWRQLQTKLSLLSNELGHKMADFVQKSLANDQGFKDAFVVVCLMGACKYRIATAPSEVGEVDEVDESTELNELNESFADQLKAFHDDFRSRPWMTYRHHFPPLSPTQQTSDVGWGCMIRCGQSMLAQCLLCHSLGRQWRLGMCGEENEQWNIYTRIIQQFIDSPTQRYSIHEITRVGSQFSGVDVGRWYGPSTIAQTLKILVNNSNADERLLVHCATDGTIYKQQVKEEMQNSTALLILVPTRLGVQEINPAYFQPILQTFQFPQSVGIAGGKPNSAFYFVGAIEKSETLICLDPHNSRPAVSPTIDQLIPEDYLTFHNCGLVKQTNLHAVDPSLLFGFYCKSIEDFNQLCSLIDSANQLGSPIISIGEHPPDYSDDLLEAFD